MEEVSHVMASWAHTCRKSLEVLPSYIFYVRVSSCSRGEMPVFEDTPAVLGSIAQVMVAAAPSIVLEHKELHGR